MSATERGQDFLLPEPLLHFPTFVLFQVVREARQIGLRVHRDNLRTPHVTVLASLAEFGPAAQKDISRRLRIDASDLVSILDELEARDLVQRRRDERDRRRYVVTITEAGGRALRGRLASAQKVNDMLLSPLNSTERAQLHELLVRIYHQHNPHRVPAGILDRLRAVTRPHR